MSSRGVSRAGISCFRMRSASWEHGQHWSYSTAEPHGKACTIGKLSIEHYRELQHFGERNLTKTLLYRYLLCGSSISMGGIAIWCMHYIGNRAIVLGNSQFAIQIDYSPAYTAVSFFVPITVLLGAFIVLGADDRVSIVRVTVGGTLAGLAICGMHYLGQAGISNYTCIFSIGNVIGSVVIAIIASIIALSVFFVLRAAWTNSWWKRAICASILACAVFGMHWVASIGTNYRLKHGVRSLNHSISRDSTAIIVIVLVCPKLNCSPWKTITDMHRNSLSLLALSYSALRYSLNGGDRVPPTKLSMWSSLPSSLICMEGSW